MDMNMVESQETEYYTTLQLKDICKQKDFQGIHDRFIRDQEIRNRMIEDHRDENLCRRWGTPVFTSSKILTF